MTTVLESLNIALHQAMQMDERVLVLGEDILDPYGGAFKVTRGLSDRYPDRVLTTPISEAGIVGVSTGLALAGYLPVVEIMFGDFLTLAGDQIINHAAKFRWMYNDQVRVPIVIRTPMGGRRGYGPTHSQTLEKLFLGVPGLQVFAPCRIENPGSILNFAIFDCEDPILFIENKLLYTLQQDTYSNSNEITINKITSIGSEEPQKLLYPDISDSPATYTMTVRDSPQASITIAAYGHMVEYAARVMVDLAYEEEIFCEVIAPTRLTPWDINPILASSRKTSRLLVVEEGTLSLGWGAEIIARISELPDSNLKAVRRIAALEYPIPASEPLETEMLPGINHIKDAVKSFL